MKKLITKGLGVIGANKLLKDVKYCKGLSQQSLYVLTYQAGKSNYSRSMNKDRSFIRFYLVPYCLEINLDINISKLLLIKRDKSLNINIDNYTKILNDVRDFYNTYLTFRQFCIQNNYKKGFVKRAMLCSGDGIRSDKVAGSFRYNIDDLKKSCELYLRKSRTDPRIEK